MRVAPHNRSNGRAVLTSLTQGRRAGGIAVVLVLVAAACGGSDTPEAGTQAPTATTATQTTGPASTSTGDATPSDTTTTSEPSETTTSTGGGDVLSAMTADELCELLPTVEIGVVLNAQSAVNTFASPSDDSTICLLMVFNGETTDNVSFELVSNGGDAGFDEEAVFVASIFGGSFEIEGVGTRAVGFTNNATQILVLAGQWVVRIIGEPVEMFSSSEQAAEIAGLVAAALQ